MRDWYENLRTPENRAAFVANKLAEVGISLDGAGPAAAPTTPSRTFLVDDRDGFFVPDGGARRISPALAEMIRYRPLHKSDQQIGGKNEVGDDDGYGEMMR